MADLLFLVITVAFFAVTAGFVMVCDRIIGPDSEHGDPHGIGEPDPDEVVAELSPAPTAVPAGAVR
ncbi:hypothetical protein BH10ACT1_BH10ACT1_23680 [soil metagenome]